jgi:hypothetical protein
MGGAAKTAAEREIFRSTITALAADWEMMPNRISLRYAQGVAGPDIFIAKQHRTSRESDHTTE